MQENKAITPIESDLKPKIKIGPVEFEPTNGLYGLAIFIIISPLLYFFSPVQNVWFALGISAILSGLISAATHNIIRDFYYRVFQKKIPLVKTIKDYLLTVMPEEEKAIIEAIKGLESVYSKPHYVPAHLKNRLENIANTLSEAFRIPNGGWYRIININYLDFTFRNTHIWNYLSSVIRSMPIDLLSDCLHNIVEFQKRKETAIHISIRDIYSGILEMYRQKDARCVYNYYSGLEKSGKALLIEHLREQDRREYNNWIAGSQKEIVLEYDDSILKTMEKSDYLSLLKLAYDIKDSANKIATQIITSETHIVLSSFMTLENNFDIMIISATNTDKNNLLIFSQTPLVWKNNGKWNYFCDPTYYPSSEFRAHWQLHKRLRAKAELMRNCIVHCHSVDILDYVKPKDTDYRDIDSSLGVIKTTNWMPHGTEEFGDHIYNAMNQSDILAAVVEDHGIWIANNKFSETIDTLQGIVDFANKQMKILD